VNRLLENQSLTNASNVRLVKAFTLRPSVDLARVAGKYEPNLPRSFRVLTRRLGTYKTESYEWLSMILFDPNYIRTIMDIGEADAHAQKKEIEAFLA
jgi:NTE family protein